MSNSIYINNLLSHNVKNILITCGSMTDGIGDVAGALYVARQLIKHFNVTLVVQIRSAHSEKEMNTAKNTEIYVQNIDMTGYEDIIGNFHTYQNNKPDNLL